MYQFPQVVGGLEKKLKRGSRMVLRRIQEISDQFFKLNYISKTI